MRMGGDPVVLIHGAWQGSWAFSRLVPLLQAEGLEAYAVDLPGNGRDGLDPAEVTLSHYLDYARGLLTRIGRPVSLVGHSGGGAVASAIAEVLNEKVARIAYVAGMMLPSGVGFSNIQETAMRNNRGTDGVTPHLLWSSDGRVSTVPQAAALRYFFDDCLPEDAADATARLTPQGEGGRAIRTVTTAERFGRLARLYVEATADRSVPLVVQRRMQLLCPGASVVSLPTGHVPQLSAPRRLAAALLPFLKDPAAPPTRAAQSYPSNGEPA